MSSVIVKHGSAELWRYRLDKPVGGSGVASVDVIVVEISDTQGRSGLGFSYVLAGEGDGATRAAQRILETHVVGKPPGHPEALHRRVCSTFNRTGRGPLYIGLAAIDVAVWDLYAKRLGVPLGIAMGGAVRAVDVYGGGLHAGQDPAEAVEVCRAYSARGCKAVKPRVAGAKSDRTLIAAVAEAMADKAFVAVDANEKCSISNAEWLLRTAAEHGLLFVEEPLPAHDLAAHRALSMASTMTVATGEHLQGSTRRRRSWPSGCAGSSSPISP